MSEKPNPANLIFLGVVTGAKGVRGELRIKSFTAVQEDLAAYGLLWDKAGRESYSVTVTGKIKGQLTATIKGVTSRTSAEALRGVELFIPRESLPSLEQNEFYHSDLIGLKVVTDDGEPLGMVRAVDNYGAGDVIEITGGSYKTLMVPFKNEFVPKIDFTAGILVLNPPDGLLKDPGERLKGSE